MSFNPSKCTIITISRSNSPLHKFYTLLWCSPAARQWSQVPGCFTEWRPAVVEARPAYHSQGQQHAGSPTAQSSPLPIKTEITCLHLSWNTVQLCGILTKSLTNLHWSQSKGELPGSQRETTPTSPVCFRCSRTYSGSLSRKGDARSGWHFSSE